ncbi:inactive leucine-rich repeat receptor-like protein kinase CORYNE isoform X2 [Cynara cardunculus var. scolymus]|uniref:inactive leucine-rich repeat receptor-like protein kinase CORYNE isoform X2 n=1 Tax=Cynara cardunculus var. scolymus TaxID=59895 RepID=UPI000D62DC7E|nr:inactive leucine-rich repeat receptor-like protein kinase CORYNE isoform X2 [Cynara cardunculus var. scolymus]
MFLITSLLFSMEKKSSKYIFLKFVFVLFHCLYNSCSVQCHGAAIKHIPADPPSPERTPEFRVKKLEPFETEAHQRKSVKRRIQRELEILASLRHRHLMSLRAYVCESYRLCLVYDYVPMGSLEDAMKRAKENELQLGWDARLRIAVGIIKGLQYLHFTLTPRTLHYNLKPSNVMLDADFEPRLGDCGLGKVMQGFNGRASGYNAPECIPNFSKYTEKSDIFSFGVILGVLLTGRDPSDPLFGIGEGSRGDMGMWFRAVLEAGDGREALDKSLLGEEMEEDEMLMAVRIAAVCLSDMPADRPSSDELVPMLTQLHSF